MSISSQSNTCTTSINGHTIKYTCIQSQNGNITILSMYIRMNNIYTELTQISQKDNVALTQLVTSNIALKKRNYRLIVFL
jgi:hypothetical protein